MITGSVTGVGVIASSNAPIVCSHLGTGLNTIYCPPNFKVVSAVACIDGGTNISVGVDSIGPNYFRILTANTAGAFADCGTRFIVVGYWKQ